MRNRSREDILKQINRVLCEQEMIRQPLPKIRMDNNIARVLTKALEILDNQFLRDKELEEKTLELIKSDFDFDKITDSFDQRKVSDSLELFYRGENEKFYLKCKLLNLNEESEKLVDFLNSD